MKKMTCLQLGGACDLEFEAETFDEIAKLSKAHGKEMFMKSDIPHLNAMNAMQESMKSPDDMHKWFAGKKAEFEALPHN